MAAGKHENDPLRGFFVTGRSGVPEGTIHRLFPEYAIAMIKINRLVPRVAAAKPSVKEFIS